MSRKKKDSMEFSVHTPNLLREILTNEGTQILGKPLQIFGCILAEVAERAIKIDDPELNILMLRLTLYSAADPELHSTKSIGVTYAYQRKRLK